MDVHSPGVTKRRCDRDDVEASGGDADEKNKPPSSGVGRVRNLMYSLVLLTLLLSTAILFGVTSHKERRAAFVKDLRNPARPLPVLPALPEHASVMVTGAAGFIGLHTVIALKKQGVRVVGIDSFSDYYSVDLKERRAAVLRKDWGVSVLNETTCDERGMVDLLVEHNVTHVVHLAAQPGIAKSLEDPVLYIEQNVKCFVTLLQALKSVTRPGLPRGRIQLVYASSSSVYGTSALPPFSEEEFAEPANVYGSTKLQMESLAAVYAQLHGISSVGLRFFTVYGPWTRPDMAVYVFASRIADGKEITIRGPGIMRDFTYVEDAANAVHLSMKYLSRGGLGTERSAVHEIFNVGTGRQHRVDAMLSVLEKLMGNKSARRRYANRTAHEMSATGANLTKVQAALGYAAGTNLGTGLQAFVRWFEEERRLAWDFDTPRRT
ncbi:UDP-glucuronate 4-epimerase 2 [Diplonema papillatum]|nr:UDP-glucuronate 4-epimerase 2 [Diplonema papillatum]